MKRFENVFVVMVTVVCALYLFFSLQMNMGTLNRPGPGFVPSILGVIGLVSSITILAGNIRRDRAAALAHKGTAPAGTTPATAEPAAPAGTTPATAEPAAPAGAYDRGGMLRFLGYLAASILFIPALNYLGALITVFVLVLTLNKVSGAKGWVRPILFAAVCSGSFYFLFELLLHVSLPRGIL